MLGVQAVAVVHIWLYQHRAPRAPGAGLQQDFSLGFSVVEESSSKATLGVELCFGEGLDSVRG